ARELFEGIGLNVREIELEDHDEIIAYVLGLSHAINIAFFTALARSGRAFEDLKQYASTTFNKQECAARGVAMENPELYYEIQHVNPRTQEVLDLLIESVEEVRKAATEPGGERFVEMMEAGNRYFGGIE
ncbi:MAG TPA: prephenate dehydrogenase dimerization domain-containing protein, partial [Methanomassiliicoccales archaeon]|nr:prephenate dehydrogenase dimerization domain-containing protein [Methanomassiliicoccales archaeon]